MHLLIFDPHEGGHYLTYLRYLVAHVAGWTRVTLVLRRGVTASEPYRHQLEPLASRVEIDASIGPESYRGGQPLVDDFVAACARHRPDHVWVPNGDALVREVGMATLRGRRPPFGPGIPEIEVGLIELRSHRPPKRWRGYVRRALDRAILRTGPWSRFHTIDPTFYTWARARGGALGRRLDVVPDPVDVVAPLTKSAARLALGLPVDGRYVGAAGGHAIRRKGSGLLMEAFARAGLADTDRLLLAGSLGEELQRGLRAEYAELHRAGRIVVIDRYLGDGELMTSIAAMDLVCTPYVNHMGSSGIVLRAAQAGRPVLAPSLGWFADMVPRFGLGETADILDAERFPLALRRALEEADRFQVSTASQRLVEYSSAENFAALWARRLRERLGLAPEEHIRPWEWVEQTT